MGTLICELGKEGKDRPGVSDVTVFLLLPQEADNNAISARRAGILFIRGNWSLFGLRQQDNEIGVNFVSMQTYSATYINTEGRQIAATIFLSSVTLTVRYNDEYGEQKDLYWLGERIQALEEGTAVSKLLHPAANGKIEQLLIRDQALVAAIKKQFKDYKFIGGVYHHTLGKVWSKILLVFGVIAGLLAILYFFLMPWIGERVAINFSKDYEIELGESMYNATIKSYQIDSAKTKIINEFYKELNYDVNYPVKITVVESPIVNAYAIPGGHIVVNSAILEGMKTPEELAALLGHESWHVEARHSLRSLFRGMARKMFIVLLTGNDAGIIGYVAENADALKGLQYSRSLETDADNNGMRLMASAGLDPIGMKRLMELLQKESPGKEPAAFMSTHPIFKDRAQNIQKQLTLYPFTAQENHQRIKQLFHDLYEAW